uniref:Pseudouridine synthase RsuA/RluA-like domain-containing protein n=1 Tax=Ciona savignyi TaxID=51511 RepID=H2Z6U7_CIOSA
MEKAWKDGRLFVDGVPICSLDDKAKNGARVVTIVHIHEQPVLDAKIKIIHNDSEMLVVDKPCSIPVCPSGRFHFNSLPLILKHEHGFTDLHLMHRIDRMTSGIQMFSKRLITSIPYWSHEWRKLVEKEYIARVVGEFPAEVTCDAKILSIDRIIGIHTTSDHRFAKESRTEFKRISTDGRTSIVSCKPKTGRTHQIRVHLKHLGYPIINDPIYNNPIWDDVSHPSPFKRGRDLCKKFADVQHQNSSLHLHSSDVYDPFCQQCSRQLIDPTPDKLRMDLHAWKYSSPNWSFESE